MSLLSFAKKVAGRTVTKPAAQKAKPPEVALVQAEQSAALAVVPIAQAGSLGMEPLITEDSIVMKGNVQTVAFRVRPAAQKRAIAAAVIERYSVTPTSVRTVNVRGKIRRRGRSEGMSNTWKKAYVSLPPGKTIDITV